MAAEKESEPMYVEILSIEAGAVPVIFNATSLSAPHRMRPINGSHQ
ncbi:MAG: hypothetical protein ACI8WM_002927 [Burkholderiaceae bacterium]|jgi:hypothetical protein